MLELGGRPRASGAGPARRREPARQPERVVSDVQPSRRSGEVLEALEQVIADRKGGDPSRSYTARLLAGGVAAAGAKVAEESGELVRAAAAEADDRVVAEAADLLYHTLVLLACRDIRLASIEDELARRFGVSGLVEKAARATGGGAL